MVITVFTLLCQTPLPLVSLIIPTRNAQALVQQAIDSILSKTTYPNYEILLIDNGSNDPKALAYFDHLDRTNVFGSFETIVTSIIQH